MKVYVVEAFDEIQGIYATREKAQEEVKEINNKIGYYGVAMVEEYEVIKQMSLQEKLDYLEMINDMVLNYAKC